MTSKLATQDIFNLINDGNNKGWTMTTGCTKEGNGLITGHLYSLLGAHQFANGVQLINIRNPWGKEKYNGPWADGSANWTPAMKAEVNQIAANDGEMWVSLQTFAYQFSTFTIA